MLDSVTVFENSAARETLREKTSPLFPCEARGLCFEANGNRILDRIDLELSEGPVTMIMGPNGAGKSVLIRLLHGMLQPSAGDVFWGGKPLDEAARKRQAMVFQAPVLLRRSVAANIEFVLGLRGNNERGRCREILEAAALSEKARQPARLLSGGERQRLSLARALATDPDVLFLDEPTASLDPASVMAIEQLVRQTDNRGVKIVFITHDLGQARRLGDEVVFMHRGRIVEQSAASRFFDDPRSREAQDYLAGRIVL